MEKKLVLPSSWILIMKICQHFIVSVNVFVISWKPASGVNINNHKLRLEIRKQLDKKTYVAQDNWKTLEIQTKIATQFSNEADIIVEVFVTDIVGIIVGVLVAGMVEVFQQKI